MAYNKIGEPKKYDWSALDALKEGDAGEPKCQHHRCIEIACLVAIGGMIGVGATLIVLLVIESGGIPAQMLYTLLVITVAFLFALISLVLLRSSFEHAKRDVLLSIIDANKSVQLEWIKSNSFRVDDGIASLMRRS